MWNSDEDDMDKPQIQISPEQLNIVLGRRNEGDTYPEQYIDRKAWQPFLEAGYTEWLKTRVLYKETLWYNGSAEIALQSLIFCW